MILNIIPHFLLTTIQPAFYFKRAYDYFSDLTLVKRIQ